MLIISSLGSESCNYCIFCFRTCRLFSWLVATIIMLASTTRTSSAFITAASPRLRLTVRSGGLQTLHSPIRRKGCSHLSSIANTPLGNHGADLLDGLDVYTVPAFGDGHPLSVYGIESQNPSAPQTQSQSSSSSSTTDQHSSATHKSPILLLHGRTWSSVPVYHLLGGSKHHDKTSQQQHEESRSLMEALLHSGLQPYAMDFRGFGGTPKDTTGCVEPMRCVEDVESVLSWIAQRHGVVSTASSTTTSSGSIPITADMPALLGWSQGALVAQMVAQKTPLLLSKLILYGSIYDPLVRYARAPLYVGTNKPNNVTNHASSPILNQFDEAIEDFTVEGTIPPEPARKFAEAALISDPIKAVWTHLYQFNNCDPARVHVPTLVVAGDQDPYAPLHVQQELFRNLGRGSDRTWSILADADHAVHLLEGRARFTKVVTSFVQNSKRSEQKPF